MRGKRLVVIIAKSRLKYYCRLGAIYVCCSDYPSDCVLSNLQNNVNVNFADDEQRSRIGVAGYVWGTDVAPLLELNKTHGSLYDFVIASECLWRHEQVCDILCASCYFLCLIFSRHFLARKPSVVNEERT